MLGSTNLIAKFDGLTEFWSPKIIGQVNNQLLKVAKLHGEFVWHEHAEEDELFYVVKGSLRVQFEGQEEVKLREGEFLTIPKGTRHNPVADEECWVLLVEPASTKHTGEVITSRTRSLEVQRQWRVVR